MWKNGGTRAQRLWEDLIMQEEWRKNQEAIDKEKYDEKVKNDKEWKDAMQSMHKMKLERIQAQSLKDME